MGKAVADLLVMRTAPEAPDALFHTPVGISDEVAATLPVAGSTAVAALEALDLRSDDTPGPPAGWGCSSCSSPDWLGRG